MPSKGEEGESEEEQGEGGARSDERKNQWSWPFRTYVKVTTERSNERRSLHKKQRSVCAELDSEDRCI